MSGKPKLDKSKTQQEEIAHLKDECVRFYEYTGVKQAAADYIGRTLKTINDWEQADEEFRYAMLRAKATFAKSNTRRIKPDNVLAHLYDEYQPPKQEVDASVSLESTVTDLSALAAALAALGHAPALKRGGGDQEQAGAPQLD